MSPTNIVSVLLIVLSIGLSPAILAESLSTSHAGKGHDSLFDICFDGNGFAVGDHGLLLQSEDHGQSWHALDTPDEAVAFLGAACVGDKAVIVGQLGKIYLREHDAWIRAETGTEERLFSVAMSHTGEGFAVGAFGTVLKTVDGGRQWEVLPVDWEAVLDDFVEPHIYDVALSLNGMVTIVGEFGLVVQSADKGSSWSVTNRGDESIFALEFRDQSHGYAVGQDGLILRTHDGGVNWARQAVDSSENLLGVWSTPAGEVLVTGIRTMLRSRDEGATWEHLTSGDISTGWYQGIAQARSVDQTEAGMAAAESVYAVGNGGKIVRIPD